MKTVCSVGERVGTLLRATLVPAFKKSPSMAYKLHLNKTAKGDYKVSELHLQMVKVEFLIIHVHFTDAAFWKWITAYRPVHRFGNIILHCRFNNKFSIFFNCWDFFLKILRQSQHFVIIFLIPTKFVAYVTLNNTLLVIIVLIILLNQNWLISFEKKFCVISPIP